MYSDVKAFDSKLALLISQLQRKLWIHFKCCTEIQKEEEYVSDDKFALDTLTSLRKQLSLRFYDFHAVAFELQLFRNPFAVSVDTCESASQMEELIQLQSDDCLRDSYKSTSSGIVAFYKQLPAEQFSGIRFFAQQHIAMFGSTYICEQTFSRMNMIKSRIRSRITDTLMPC